VHDPWRTEHDALERRLEVEPQPALGLDDPLLRQYRSFLAGIVRGETLGAYRPWIILLTFVFAAVATPSTDPFSMVMLAIPMSLLFLVSEGIARVVDRRRARRDGVYGDLSDDEASPLDVRPDAVGPSSLDEEDD